MTDSPSTAIRPIFAIALLILASAAAATAGVPAPTLSKVFTPNTIGPGSVSTITFTITDVSGSPVTDLAFTDVLPTVPGDVDIADPANASTTCNLGESGSLSAPAGGGTITLIGAEIGALQSCAVTVDVTASAPGVHTNPAITLSSSIGSSMSLAVDLTVDASSPGFSKSFAPSSIPLGGRSTLTFTIDNTASESDVTFLSFTDSFRPGLEIAGPANASTTCGGIGPTLTAIPGTSTISMQAFGSPVQGAQVVASGASCTVTVDVLATGVGMLDNTSGELTYRIGFDQTIYSSGMASATLEVTVTPLALTKAFADDPVPPGGTVTLDFTINNFDRDFAATGIAFSDDLTTLVPALAGLTFGSLLSNDCGGTVSGVGGTTIGLSGGALGPEGFCTLSVSLSVPAGAMPGAYTNTTSTVTATVGGSPVVGNMASDDLFVEPAPILTKEFLGDPVNPGDPVVLEFTVTNTSATSSATEIAFEDVFATVLQTASVTPGNGCCGAGSTCTFTPLFDPLPPSSVVPASLTISGGELAPAGMPGDSCTFSITLDVVEDAAPGIYPNITSAISATVDGATRIGGPANDTLTVISAPVLTKAFVDDPVAPGGTVTLEFTVSHSPDATGPATDITFTDDLTFLTGLTANLPPSPDPPCGAGSSLTGSAGDTLLTLMGGTLMPGEICTFGVTLDVPVGAAPGSHTNTTSGIGATVEGLAVTSAPATDDLAVSGLSFSKEFLGDPVFPGETLTLRFTIENTHPTDDATSIAFNDNLTDVLPGSPDISSTGPPSVDTCGGSEVGTATLIFYTGGSLTSGLTCIVEYEILVPAGAANGAYTNTTSNLTAMQGGGLVIVDAASDTLVINSNVLSLIKEFTDDPVGPGDSVTLEFTLSNFDAVQPASDIDFTDDLGAALPGLTFDSVLFNDCGAMALGIGTTMITVDGASLGAGGSCTIRTSISVPGMTAAGIYTNTTSEVTGMIGGFAVTGDAASDNLEVLQLLLFSKSFDGPTTATGVATLTFTITNPGSDTATDIEFTDNLDDVISGLIAISLPAVPCGAGSSITGISFLTFTGGELPPMGGMCTFDVDVLVPATATAGTFPNITSDLLRAGLRVADPATADLVIEPPPTWAKLFVPDAIFAGGVSTLRFTTDNSASALAATGLDFTDNLPAAMVVATPPNSSTTCSGGTLTAIPGTGVISYTGGSVGAGASCTIDVDVTSVIAGAHVNSSGDLTSSSGNSGPASDTLVVAPAADVSVTKSDGVTSATPGGSVTYTIVAANAGPSADPAATLADVFPSPPLTCTYTSVAAGGATGNTAAGAGDLAETLSLPVGSSVTYTVGCGIDSSAIGTLSNTASISPSIMDPVPGNNTATDNDTVLSPSADLAITKTDGVTSAVPGQTTLTYTIVASNSGLSDDPSVEVDDTFPAELSCTYTSVATGGATGNTAAGAGDLAETLSMPAGSSVTYTATCSIDAAASGTLSNTATIDASVSDPNTGNNSATDDDTVLAPEADLAVSKTDGVTSAVPGLTTLTYTIVASNAGPSEEPAGSLNDTFPTDLSCSWTSIAAGGATGNTSGSGDLAETLFMPVGGSVTYTADCSIDAAATGTLSNTATIGASIADPDTGNNSATDDDTVLAPEADLAVTKTDGVTSAVPGQTTLTYTIVASNTGPSEEPAGSLTDTFPADLSCSWTSIAAGGATGNTSGSGDLADTLFMPVGGSVTYTADCTIDPTATGTLSNTVTISGTATDPVQANNSATDDDTVLMPQADLSIEKTTSDDPVISPTFTYTLAVTNLGPSDADSVEATDVLPAGIVFDSSADGCTEAAGTVTCPFGTVAIDDTVVRTFVVALDAPWPATIINSATVSSANPDPDSGNNESTVETAVDDSPPEVTDVATAAGSLAVCDTVRVPVTNVQVTIADDLALGTSVDDPANFLLVGSGPDADFSTGACAGGVVGDDVAIGIVNFSLTMVDPVTATAELGLGGALDPGLYRLLVCDTVTDATGNPLDGDGDTTPGGDFVVSFFRVDPLNLFENGHFDDCPVTLDPWQIAVTAPNAVLPGTLAVDDSDGSPFSASARVFNSTADSATMAQCVPVAGAADLDLRARVRFVPATTEVATFQLACEFFGAPACSGASLGVTSSVSVLEDEGGVWSIFSSDMATPGGTVSALCDFTVAANGASSDFDLFMDGLFVGQEQGLFSDGFESGDVSAWSSSVP